MSRSPVTRVAAALATAVVACQAVAPTSSDRSLVEVEAALARPDGDRAAAAARLEALLDATPDAPGRARNRRLWTSYLLADLHAAAASRPFLTEPTTRREHVRAIAVEAARGGASARPPASTKGQRPSATSHLVACLHHATRALALLDRVDIADGGFAPPEGIGGRVPRTPASARANLTLLIATSYARLGFQREVGAALAASPELLEPESCMAFLEDRGVRSELRPWVCQMVSVHLRASDELEAYRFAILAIEGEMRFGHGLPEDVVAELETWILGGASVRFVCPRTQTEYIPGLRRSPVSGVRHIEYVAVSKR